MPTELNRYLCYSQAQAAIFSVINNKFNRSELFDSQEKKLSVSPQAKPIGIFYKDFFFNLFETD